MNEYRYIDKCFRVQVSEMRIHTKVRVPCTVLLLRLIALSGILR